MAHTGPNALLEAAQIQVDTSDSSGAQDSTTLAPYQNTGAVQYNLRWRHWSTNSYMGDYYDYFSVTLAYECDADYLTLGTEIG